MQAYSSEFGIEVYPHFIDLRDAEYVEFCAADVVKHLGKMDILVNSDGVGGLGDPTT